MKKSESKGTNNVTSVYKEASKIFLPEWFWPVSTDEFREIETKYGQLAVDLLEVAGMIQQADEEFHISLHGNKLFEKLVHASYCGREITGMSNQANNVYHLGISLQTDKTLPIVMRILYSLVRLKRKIEYLVGKKTAKDFFNQLRDALQFVDTTPRLVSAKNIKSATTETLYGFVGDDRWGGTRKINDFVNTLKEWHESDMSTKKPAEIQQSQRTEIPSEIKLMKQIAEHLRIWFQEHSDDKCYPSGTVPLRFRNGISLKLEFEVYLDQVLTWLRVIDHKEIAHSFEQERDSFLSDLRSVEQAIERGDNPHLELIELRSKITGLIGTLEHTAKVFTDNLTPEQPKEPGQKTTPAIRQRIWIGLKAFIKEAYRLAMRSFFDSTMNK